jgi:hypothetical protein
MKERRGFQSTPRHEEEGAGGAEDDVEGFRERTTLLAELHNETQFS